jgi:glucose dehydrogenase
MDPIEGHPRRDTGPVPKPPEKAGAVDECMGSWFFYLVGAVLVVSSVLLWIWSAVIACTIAIGAVATFGFGAFGPRDRKIAFATVVLAILPDVIDAGRAGTFGKPALACR